MKAYPCLLLCAIITLDACTKSDTSLNNASITPFSDLSQQVPNAKVDSAVAMFINKYNIPGLSIAISKDGKMVYLKGYGYADLTSKSTVSVNSLFRLAALSKTFSAVAIMKLVEDNKLNLDAMVFGNNGILGTTYGTLAYNSNLLNITVRDLMQETTGWASDSSDPLLAQPDYTLPQLITWTLDNRLLSTLPGTNYVASNFTYSLLGRVIEKVSGTSYNNYVKVKVLEPCGISDMQLSANTINGRKKNEVRYYGYGDEDPYGFNIARMDASEGWIASAEDVLKFVVSIDGFKSKADLLKPASITAITTPSAANPNYASGWFVNNSNWTNAGNLPGSATEMVRSDNGFCWVILCNARSTQSSFTKDLDNIVWSVINDKTTIWPAPNIDLF